MSTPSTVIGYVIPNALFDVFEVQLPNAPCKTGMVWIYAGNYQGAWFVNQALFTSCPEWKAAFTEAQALATGNSLSLEPVTIPLSDLANPAFPPKLPPS
jgi:hypothetical protein